MSSSSSSLPLSEALTTLQYCLLYDAESSDVAMHSDAWVQAVFVAWNWLHDAWLHDEEGFLDEQEWFDMEGQLWIMLSCLNYDHVNDSCKEFNTLAVEALKCGIIIELIEMESESKSEAAPSSAQNPKSAPVQEPESQFLTPPAPDTAPVPKFFPRPQDLIPPMLHTLTPKLNDGPGFGMRFVFATAPKTLTGHPRKVKEKTAVMVCKRGGLGEPVPKNARVMANEDLCPMGLLVPDQDFRDYIGCQGTFFKRELAGKVGHFMSVPCNTCSKAHAQSLVTEIRGFLKTLRQEGHQMNNSDGNIPSLFLASHLDNIELVSELFEKRVVEGEELLDMEAQEAGSEEDLDMEGEEDKLQGDK
ncbi:hypothetical protein EDD85DRAFT_793809 [Armillaria nabsnona]|nr:hypothetical protein EDD85DRAFT_793809 [Armillaria nabsnona]